MALSPPASPFLCTSSHRHITGSCYSYSVLLHGQSLLSFVFFTLCECLDFLLFDMLRFFFTLKNPYFSPTASSLFHYQWPICDHISHFSYPDLSPSLALTLLTNHFLEINSSLGFHILHILGFLYTFYFSTSLITTRLSLFLLPIDVLCKHRCSPRIWNNLSSRLCLAWLLSPNTISLQMTPTSICLALISLVSVSRLSPAL